MFGNNPKRTAKSGDGFTLDVQEIFSTLQGEGPFAGWPAVFVRLGGCNLACQFCDTEFESFEEMALEAVLSRVAELSVENGKRVRHLVVLTGGEPLRQPVNLLCERLLEDGFEVQVETNGTLWRPLPDAVSVICSPKNPENKGYLPIRPDLAERVTAYKFILSKSKEGYTDVPEWAVKAGRPIYVQPMDEYDGVLNQVNMAYATEIAQRNGYRLSVQLHKLAGIP